MKKPMGPGAEDGDLCQPWHKQVERSCGVDPCRCRLMVCSAQVTDITSLGAMADWLVAVLFSPPSSTSEAEAEAAATSQIMDRACCSKSRSRSRSRAGPAADAGAEPGAGAASGSGATSEAGPGAGPGATSGAASGATSGAEAEPGAGPAASGAEAGAETGADSLLQLWEDFDEDDTDNERQLEHAKQESARLAAMAEKQAKQRRKADAAEAAAARAEADQLDQLEESYRHAMRACGDLPIEWIPFEQCAFIAGDSIEPFRFLIASRAAATSQNFYVGGTVNVRRRWLGDLAMQGHCESYSSMCIIGVAIGRLGGRIEAALIDYAKNMFPLACENRCRDSRGLTAGINFIYMCHV